MKRRKHVLTAGLSIAALAMGLGGCSEKMTVEKLWTKMDEAMKDKALLSMDWKMDMDMDYEIDLASLGLGAGSQSLNLAAELTGNSLISTADQLSYTNMDMAMSMFGEDIKQSMEIYTETAESGSTTVYMNIENEWIKSTTEAAASGDNNSFLSGFSGDRDKFTLTDGPVTYAATTCYELKAEMDAGDIEKIIDEMQYANALQGSGLDSMGLSLTGFEGKSFQMTMYVDEETALPVGLALSMVENAAAESQEGAAETTGVAESTENSENPAETEASGEDNGLGFDMNIQYNNISFTADVSYPEEGSVVIPEEAKNAYDIGDPSSLEGLLESDSDGEVPTSESGDSMYNSLENPVLLKEFADGAQDAVVCDSDGLTVAVTRIYTDGADALYADLTMTNSTEKNLDVYTAGVAVNHTMTDGSFFETVEAGSDKQVFVYVPNLSEKGIEQVGSMSIMVIASDSTDYSAVITGPVSEIFVDESQTDYHVRDGLGVVYEDDKVQVIAYEKTISEYDAEIPLCIVNRSGARIGLSCESIQSNGQDMTAILYGDMFPDSCLYATIYVEKETLSYAGIEELGEVIFKLSAFDAETYNTLFETGDITVS